MFVVNDLQINRVPKIIFQGTLHFPGRVRIITHLPLHGLPRIQIKN